MPATPPLGKESLRVRMRAARAARPAQERAAVADALALRAGERFGTGVVAAYASYGGEPGTGPLRITLRAAGVLVLLPVVHGHQLGWVIDDGGEVVPGGERGMPEPTGPLAGVGAEGLLALGCTVVLLPALAVSQDGVRIGKGGGYYDRLLETLPPTPRGPLRVAVVHDDEVLPVGAVPAEPHDLLATVDDILTPGLHSRG